MKRDRQNFLLFWAIVCPFTPLTTRKIKNDKKWKKKKNPGDIIILHKCTKNHDHILYCFSDMAREGSFWTAYWPFTPPLMVQRFKFSKKWKKHLKISSFYACVPKNYDHIMYSFWNMARDGRTDGQTEI